MATQLHVCAAAQGPSAPERSVDDNARGQPGVIEGQEKADSAYFQGSSVSAQAALAIEGEDYARAYLDRLHADAAQPGELATLLSFLTGEMLSGACRLIEKSLRGGHHA